MQRLVRRVPNTLAIPLAIALGSSRAAAEEASPAAPPAARAAAQPAPAAETRLPPWGLEGPYRFEVGATVGYAHRADDPPLFSATNSAGISGGLLLRFFTAERLGFGLGYEHIGLWTEESGLLETGTYELARSLDTIFFSLRLRPFRGDELGAFVDIAGGPSFQSASLRGAAWSAVTPGLRAPVRCDASGSAGFAFRVQVGMEAAVTEAFGMDLGAGVDLYRHESDVIGGCAPGAGSAIVPGVRLGFSYGWGL